MTAWQKLLDYWTTAEVSQFPVLNVLFQSRCMYDYNWLYVYVHIYTVYTYLST